MTIKCPHCGTEYEAAQDEFGRFVNCEICGKGFIIGQIRPRMSVATPVRDNWASQHELEPAHRVSIYGYEGNYLVYPAIDIRHQGVLIGRVGKNERIDLEIPVGEKLSFEWTQRSRVITIAVLVLILVALLAVGFQFSLGRHFWVSVLAASTISFPGLLQALKAIWTPTRINVNADYIVLSMNPATGGIKARNVLSLDEVRRTKVVDVSCQNAYRQDLFDHAKRTWVIILCCLLGLAVFLGLLFIVMKSDLKMAGSKPTDSVAVRQATASGTTETKAQKDARIRKENQEKVRLYRSALRKLKIGYSLTPQEADIYSRVVDLEARFKKDQISNGFAYMKWKAYESPTSHWAMEYRKMMEIGLGEMPILDDRDY